MLWPYSNLASASAQKFLWLFSTSPPSHPHPTPPSLLIPWKGGRTRGSFLKPEQPRLADTHSVLSLDSENPTHLLEVRPESPLNPAQVSKMCWDFPGENHCWDLTCLSHSQQPPSQAAVQELFTPHPKAGRRSGGCLLPSPWEAEVQGA